MIPRGVVISHIGPVIPKLTYILSLQIYSILGFQARNHEMDGYPLHIIFPDSQYLDSFDVPVSELNDRLGPRFLLQTATLMLVTETLAMLFRRLCLKIGISRRWACDYYRLNDDFGTFLR